MSPELARSHTTLEAPRKVAAFNDSFDQPRCRYPTVDSGKSKHYGAFFEQLSSELDELSPSAVLLSNSRVQG